MASDFGRNDSSVLQASHDSLDEKVERRTLIFSRKTTRVVAVEAENGPHNNMPLVNSDEPDMAQKLD